MLEEKFNFDFKSFKFFAGHSLGEYCALVCSGSLNFLDALYLLHERGKAMQEAVPVGKGKMLAVLGIKYEELDELIKNSKIHNKQKLELGSLDYKRDWTYAKEVMDAC